LLIQAESQQARSCCEPLIPEFERSPTDPLQLLLLKDCLPLAMSYQRSSHPLAAAAPDTTLFVSRPPVSTGAAGRGSILQAQVMTASGMDLWILQKRQSNLVEPYELTRLREEARALAIRLEAVAPDEVDLIVSRGGRRSIRRCGIELDLPDALLARTGSATDYFSLAILRQLEHLGVAVINSSRSIEAVKDKLYAHQILSQNNLPIPRTMLVRFPVNVDLVAEQIGFPCVVKLLVGSYGEGVLLSRDPIEFRDLIELISSLDRSQALILQQYIGSRPGQDLRVWVIGGRVLGAMLRRSTDGSFKANISRGGDGVPHALTAEIERLAQACAAALQLDIAGVDLLFDADHYCVCEVNSAPGFAGFEAATGINVARAILEHGLSRTAWKTGLSPAVQLGAAIPIAG